MSNASISFAQFYRLDQFRAFQAQWNSAPRDRGYGTPEYSAWIKASLPHMEAFESGVAAFLCAMRSAGHLSPIEHTQGRGHRFAEAWNRWLQDGEVSADASQRRGQQPRWDEETVVQAISNLLRMARLDHTGASEVAAGFESFVAEIDRGRFEAWQISDAGRSRCSMSGQVISLDFTDGWKPRLGIYRHANHERYEFEPVAGPAPDPHVQVLSILVPSGELLVADWFRLEVPGHSRFLSDILDVGKPTHSLETAWDMAVTSKHYAQQGLMSVFVGNSCPSVYQRGDHLLIARESAEHEAGFGPEGKDQCAICTDLWWASIVDKQVLIALCARKLGVADATRLVEDYMATDANHSVVRVEPGVLHVHHPVGLPDLSRFWCEDGQVSFRAIDEPYAVLANRPLRWSYQGPAQPAASDELTERIAERARG